MRDIDELIEEVKAATDRFVTSALSQTESTLSAPSALPEWSRAHVLTHVARNADGLRALLLATRSQWPLRMYASPRTRSADIEAGATRPADVVVDDVVEASRRFIAEASTMPAGAWDRSVAFISGQESSAPLVPAPDLVLMRLQEVELHHLDLGGDYGVKHIPVPVAERLLRRVEWMRRRQQVTVRVVASDIDLTAGPSATEAEAVVEGALQELLGWFSGRSDGAALKANPRLPALPPLG